MALAIEWSSVAGPHNHVCAYHKPQLRHRLSWLLAARPGSSAEDPNSPWRHCRLTAVLATDHRAHKITVDPSGPSWQDMLSWIQSYYMSLHMVLCTTKPMVTVCSSEPPPPPHLTSICEGLYSWRQSIQSRRCDYFFKYADTYARQQETENRREHNTTKKHGKLAVTDPKEMDI